MKVFRLLVLLGFTAAAFAGCGSNDKKAAGGGSATTTSKAAAGGDVVAANTLAAKLEAPWKQAQTNMPSASPPAAKGKFLVGVTCAVQIEGCRILTEGHIEAAKALAWKTQLIDGKGTAQGWATAIQAAIQLKPDVIALGAVDPRAIGDGLKQAQSKGIKVIGTVAAADSNSLKDGVDFSNGTEGISVPLGEGSATYAISQTGTKTNAIAMVFPEFQAGVIRHDAFAKKYKELCPSCKLKTITVKIAEWGTTLPARVQALLQQDPSVNWVFSPADEAAVDAANGIQAAGLNGKVHVVGGNGALQSFARIASDPTYAATVATSYNLAAWEAVDNANRLVQGKPAAPLITQPNRLINARNVSTIGKGKYWSTDFDYRSVYKKLWGF